MKSLTSREAHNVKDSVQLVMMVRVAGLDIFLTTVEYGLRRKQLRKNAADRPDVWKENRADTNPEFSTIRLVAHVQEKESTRPHRWLWCSAELPAAVQALCTRR